MKLLTNYLYAKARKVSETLKKNMKIVFDDYFGR
jgi:hypothetical protein